MEWFERTADLLDPGLARADAGIGGTGGGGEENFAVGGGEFDRREALLGGERLTERFGVLGTRRSGDGKGGSGISCKCAFSFLPIPNSSPSSQSSDCAFSLK